MQVRDLMTPSVRTITPSASIREAAKLMGNMDVGMLPVQDGDRLVGAITDRDIVLRAVAFSKGPDTKVSEAMTPEVMYCYEDDDADYVCRNMADLQLRRLPVVSREKRLVGIVSLSDLAQNGDTEDAGQALEGITRPGGPHSQSEARI